VPVGTTPVGGRVRLVSAGRRCASCRRISTRGRLLEVDSVERPTTVGPLPRRTSRLKHVLIHSDADFGRSTPPQKCRRLGYRLVSNCIYGRTPGIEFGAHGRRGASGVAGGPRCAAAPCALGPDPPLSCPPPVVMRKKLYVPSRLFPSTVAAESSM